MLSAKLEQLEKEGLYVFHGSGVKIVGSFEPRQAYNHDQEGNKTKDDKPAVHASDKLSIAIFMALVNRENCPEGYFSGFSVNDGVETFRVSKQTFDQLHKDIKGYVYVFNRNLFSKRKSFEWVSYKEVMPLKVFEVGYIDLPQSIEII